MQIWINYVFGYIKVSQLLFFCLNFSVKVGFTDIQCAKDYVPHNCGCEYGRMLTSVFTQLKLYFHICVVFTFSKVRHMKTHVYQWNMEKKFVLIFLTILYTHSTNLILMQINQKQLLKNWAFSFVAGRDQFVGDNLLLNELLHLLLSDSRHETSCIGTF